MLRHRTRTYTPLNQHDPFYEAMNRYEAAGVLSAVCTMDEALSDVTTDLIVRATIVMLFLSKYKYPNRMTGGHKWA